MMTKNYHGSTFLKDLALLIVEVSVRHSPRNTQHSVGILLTFDWPVAKKIYLKSHNTCKRQISMIAAGFEPEIPTSERRHTHALDRAATETCGDIFQLLKLF
jgi:hypothetical protein